MSKSIWLKDEDQKGNFSNQKQDTFDPGKGYVGIRLQQGSPLLDRDWNELEDIRRYAEVMLRKYFIGNGVPDENGFRIEAVETPANDFKILAGRCLVEGFEVVNEPVDTDGNPLDFILYSQQEGVEPLSVPDVDRNDTVYLDVCIEEITGQQEAALNNPQDINVETCTRHKLYWKVRVDEGSNGHPQEAFHWYYPIARIVRQAEKQGIDEVDIVEDMRLTRLALHSIKEAVDAADWVTTSKIEDNAVTNSKIADGAVTNSKIEDNAVTTTKIANKSVTNAKLNDGSVNQEKLSTEVRGKLVTNGNDHNHSGGDGAQIMHGSLNKNDGTNPHGTTAQDVEALPITGGIVNGNLTVNGNVGIGTTEPTVELEVNGEVKSNNLTAMGNDFQQIFTDAFGSSYSLVHDGKPKLTLNLRETINAMLNGFWSGTVPVTPPQPLTNDTKGNKEPFALVDRSGTVWVFWHTGLEANYSIYCNRCIDGTWQGEETLINAVGSDEYPFALEDKNGTIWIFWHTSREANYSIYFDCCIDGAWQGNRPLSAENVENVYPFALEDQEGTIWVFWISSTDGTTHEIKYRKHLKGAAPDDWQEEGTVTSGSLTISPNIYAVEYSAGNIWVFWELPGAYHNSIYCRRYINGEWEGSIEGEILTSEQYGDSWPFALTDRRGVTWFFWFSYRDGNSNIYYKHCIDGTWQDDEFLLTPNLGSDDDSPPFALEDNNGNIWVFWHSNREGYRDIWYNVLVRGAWQGDRRLTTGTSEDGNPFALTDSSGNIWVFWHSMSGDNYNIRYSRIIFRI